MVAAELRVSVGGADVGNGRSSAMEIRAKLKGLLLVHFTFRPSRFQNHITASNFLPFSFHLNFKLIKSNPSPFTSSKSTSFKHKFLDFFKVKQWAKTINQNKKKKKKKRKQATDRLAPPKKLYWDGTRISRTIWLWILLPLILIPCTCYFLVQLIHSFRTAFILKFIYKACKYAATSSGLLRDFYEDLRSLVFYL